MTFLKNSFISFISFVNNRGLDGIQYRFIPFWTVNFSVTNLNQLRKETEELLQKRLLKSCPSCRYYAALLRASLREAFGCKLASVMRLSNIIIFLGALCEFAVLTISKGVPSDMKETSDFFLFIGNSQLLYGDAMTYGFANILRRELRAINRGTSFEVH